MIRVDVFPRFTVWGRRWFFHGQDVENGEILFQSEGYTRRDNAKHTVEKLKREMGSAIVVFEPEKKR